MIGSVLISKMRVLSRFVLLWSLFTGIQGCSFESILPDRQKEYKYSTEIPPLEVPPDLSTSSIENSSERPSFRPAESTAGTRPGETRRSATIEALPETAREEESGSQVEQSEEGAYINIQERFPIAWRMVGRALSRLEIEVEDLNRSEGLYYIIFEDKRNRQVDDSFWASLAFWNSANAIEEQRFQVLVEDHSETTEVRIRDDEGQVLAGGTGLDLLRMIQKKINEQISEKK
ncbi:MAG: outer membrane protein assembly factor BamC [Gammaproteobacteria bacterium]